ncbi:MAG: hypothetical protein JNM17_14425 [Archangium sp.]|nr:hypothetical protein [Archangium sp.]
MCCALLVGAPALAKPPAPGVFCAKYPTASVCIGGQPACTYCHVAAPQRNAYGAALEAVLVPTAPRPLSDGDFANALPAALAAVELADTDGDAVNNLTEITRGTSPSDPRSFPNDIPCAGNNNPQFKVCQYDFRYVYKKLLLDFCGASPTYAQVQTFLALGTDDLRRTFLDSELDRCMATDFWRGKNGILWRLAHPKVRPVGSLKAGEDQGQIPLADYYDDYAMYAWSQTDDHDARDVLTANFYVQRCDALTMNVAACAGAPAGITSYRQVPSLPVQGVDVAHRAGNITTAWTLVYFVMFTALPRNAASQMYRGYLGLDIAKQEGLYSVPNEPVDYDAKGVQQQACAACHATLDPLSYPFRNFNGLSGGQNQFARYVPNRIETFFNNQTPMINQIPESGAIFGQPVTSLAQWAQVAANSDQFLVATTTDYWKLLIGHPPRPEENTEFVNTWRALKNTHNYRVRGMLHDLIRTEAYGAP